MLTAHEMRDKYAELAEELQVIVEIAQEEKRELNQEEQTRADAIETNLSDLEIKIKRQDRIETRLNAKAAADGQRETRHKREPEPEGKKLVGRYNFLKAIDEHVNQRSLTGLELEMHQEAVKEARANKISLSGFGVPSMFFRNPRQQRDMTAGTPTAGGNTIQTTVENQLIDYLWPRTTIEQLGATVLSGLTANLSLPKKSAVPTAVWEGETDAGAESNPTTAVISITPNRLGTYVDVSKQLLLQSQVPGLDRIVRGDIESSIGQALEIAAINGSGSGSQPTGILNNGTVGVEAIGTNGGTPDWGNIVALEANVANNTADIGSMAYLTTPGIRGLLKTTEKGTNTAVFIWDNMPMGGVMPTVGEGQLNGYRAAVSTLVPSDLEKGTGYNLHAVIFGVWSQLIMAQFGGLDVVIDPYTQAANTILRIVVNSWWDIDLRHAESFAVIKDASAGEFNT